MLRFCLLAALLAVPALVGQVIVVCGLSASVHAMECCNCPMLRFCLLAALLATPALPAANASRDLARSVTIYRDTYGVPHIYAKTDAGVVFGLMYAQAEDNFWQLETDFVRIVGRSAELEGTRGIAGDLLVRAYESEKRAKEDYAQATPHFHALCDAFAGGLNYYLETHPKSNHA